MRRVSFPVGFVLGFAMSACVHAAPEAPLSPQGFDTQDLQSKTIALVVELEGVTKAYCSGVWVSDSVFITANHCLRDANFYTTSSDPPDALHAASVLAQDPDHDLALVASVARTPSHGVARVAPYFVTAGAKVATMSHPLGLWWSFSSGDVAAVRELNADPDAVYIQTTAPVSGGSSGCGLFDTQGYLLGIAHGIAPAGANLGFFMHTQYVTSLLRSHGL